MDHNGPWSYCKYFHLQRSNAECSENGLGITIKNSNINKINLSFVCKIGDTVLIDWSRKQDIQLREWHSDKPVSISTAGNVSYSTVSKLNSNKIPNKKSIKYYSFSCSTCSVFFWAQLPIVVFADNQFHPLADFLDQHYLSQLHITFNMPQHIRLLNLYEFTIQNSETIGIFRVDVFWTQHKRLVLLHRHLPMIKSFAVITTCQYPDADLASTLHHGPL